MPKSWNKSPEVFARILRRHGQDPDSVGDVPEAWAAFREFVQVEFAGVGPAQRGGDGFVVQWGDSPEGGRPTLTFTRLFAVDAAGGRRDEAWQPQMWTVDLRLSFADDPAWADLAEMAWTNSMGFDFDPIGPERAAVLADIEAFIETLPQVRAMWRAKPVGSGLVLAPAD